VTAVYRTDEARRSVEQRYREILSQWPVPHARSVVRTRQGDTSVVSSGPEGAPPVVLLHGAGFNSVAWVDDVAAWSRTHRLYAVDVVGEPGLSAPSRPPLGSDAYAEWLDDVLDGLGEARAAFVGTSLGGWLALDYALRRPGGIGRQRYGVVLASLFLVLLGERGRRAALRLALGPVPGPGVAAARVASSDVLAEYALLIQRSYRPRRDRLPVFTDEHLRHLDVPLLVVAGARDRMLDAHDTARRLRHVRPDATVVLHPDAGHLPTRYAETVHTFLDGKVVG
jgi:pimeloyl-ACP methyl ester carboxylesterase